MLTNSKYLSASVLEFKNLSNLLIPSSPSSDAYLKYLFKNLLGILLAIFGIILLTNCGILFQCWLYKFIIFTCSYPANCSSPPSPVKTTVTFGLVSLANK